MVTNNLGGFRCHCAELKVHKQLVIHILIPSTQLACLCSDIYFAQRAGRGWGGWGVGGDNLAA